MAIISKTGRKSIKVRLLVWSFYLILVAGAVSMVYPFMLMLAGTSKSSIDTPEAEIIPAFLVSEKALYRKDREAFFNESLQIMQTTSYSDSSSFKTVEPPAHINKKLTDKWHEFLKKNNFPFYFYSLAYVQTPVSRKTLPLLLRKFKSLLYEKYNGSIEQMNRDMGTEFVAWNTFFVMQEEYLERRVRPRNDAFTLAFREFKIKQTIENRYYFSPEGFFKSAFLYSRYTKDIKSYNKYHKTNYSSWDDVKLSERLPENATELQQKDWTEFVRFILNLFWIRADKKAQPLYQNFLQAKYGRIENLNKNYGTSYKSFKNIPLIEEPPHFGMPLADWEIFIKGWQDPDTGKMYIMPTRMLHIHSIEFIFRDSLKKRYGNIHKLNESLETPFRNWTDILPPQKEFNYTVFKERTGMLRREYLTRNFISVFEYIFLHGRGILNTVIYCSLAIGLALLVNPLAAYALSRYKPPSTYKVLLFLMLTMAFPPMVTQIPVFLMLREFNLLNTFFALILPGMANGYSIFLLKGFFDSLPRELYESAELDGAGEIRIFWQITMSLSKPILAVIALNTFTLAYSNFMMALLICQNEKMWTIMPWLYQLQQNGCQGIIFSSLVIAAVPTFLIFVFCQNIIMRGIVVPVEK